MNNEQPIIVGLDIGTTKIAVIAGRKNEYGKLEILGFGRSNSNGVKHGQVLNIDETIKAIMIMQQYENCLGIPAIVTLIYRQFCESYRNPLDPQGFIVLAYIMNAFAFLSKHNKYIFKSIAS